VNVSTQAIIPQLLGREEQSREENINTSEDGLNELCNSRYDLQKRIHGEHKANASASP